MKKMLNHKKGVAGVILILILIGLAMGGSAIYKGYTNRDLGESKYCVLEEGKRKCYSPTQTTFVEKQCLTEGGGCSTAETKTNTPLEFRRICKLLQTKRGANTDASFLVLKNGLNCLTCSDYYREESLFDGAKVDPIARTSKTKCESGDLVDDSARCKDGVDCNKKMKGDVNILDVEEHVEQAKSPEERKEPTDEDPCPDKTILKFLAIPDVICKAKLALSKAMFLAFQIMLWVILAVILTILIVVLVKAFTKKKKKKRK